VLRVRVETPCRPTESLAKVKLALLKLFPDLAFQREDDLVVGTTASLERLRELIRSQRIRDTARGQLLAARGGDRTRIVLSKQAAFMGVVNFAAGSALGDIALEIQSDDLTAVIDWVAESTVERPLTPSARTEGT
jgi:predicted RNA binding protein with dsRBD fold (UPF0201 family)